MPGCASSPAKVERSDSLKVAILTALHLAQERQDTEESVGGLVEAVEAGSKKWIRAIDRVL